MYICQDCSADLQKIGEVYMLRNDVWFPVAKGTPNLCIGCFEIRADRSLRSQDFSEHQQNFKPGKSQRMLNRLTMT